VAPASTAAVPGTGSVRLVLVWSSFFRATVLLLAGTPLVLSVPSMAVTVAEEVHQQAQSQSRDDDPSKGVHNSPPVDQ
jgi:hypothetical protein